MFLRFIDRTATKNEIRDLLLYNAEQEGEPLTKARANNLADKFKKGQFDPDLARIIQYTDPTGETAAKNVDRERMEIAA